MDRPSHASDSSSDSEAGEEGLAAGTALLPAVDHSSLKYNHFRRNFYVEGPEVSHATDTQVTAWRTSTGIKVSGRDPPAPIRAWNQAGLSRKLLDVLKKCGFKDVLPIQAQALPAIIGGRDCITNAKTGSGKTLAFVLPMLRHIKDQAPLAAGDGPIGLVIAPSRELVLQVNRDTNKLARALGLTSVAVFGGSGRASQVSELKRGAEVVVCTPGGMIDMLVADNDDGITNLRKVTFVVLDEANRLLQADGGAQLQSIVDAIRPDRQMIITASTSTPQLEHICEDPVRIDLTGKSSNISTIPQVAVVGAELVGAISAAYEEGPFLIFVRDDVCEAMCRALVKLGYPCKSLHGGMDSWDRACVRMEYKAGLCSMLVTCSAAIEGLSLKDTCLIIHCNVEASVDAKSDVGVLGLGRYCEEVQSGQQVQQQGQHEEEEEQESAAVGTAIETKEHGAARDTASGDEVEGFDQRAVGSSEASGVTVPDDGPAAEPLLAAGGQKQQHKGAEERSGRIKAAAITQTKRKRSSHGTVAAGKGRKRSSHGTSTSAGTSTDTGGEETETSGRAV